MDELELHMDINVQVVIPEWLRRKMGLTDDTTHETAREEEARKEAIGKLADALRDCHVSDLRITYSEDAVRSHDRD